MRSSVMSLIAVGMLVAAGARGADVVDTNIYHACDVLSPYWLPTPAQSNAAMHTMTLFCYSGDMAQCVKMLADQEVTSRLAAGLPVIGPGNLPKTAAVADAVQHGPPSAIFSALSQLVPINEGLWNELESNLPQYKQNAITAPQRQWWDVNYSIVVCWLTGVDAYNAWAHAINGTNVVSAAKP